MAEQSSILTKALDKKGFLVHPRQGRFCPVTYLMTVVGQIERLKKRGHHTDTGVKAHFWAYREARWCYMVYVRPSPIRYTLLARDNYQAALYELYTEGVASRFPEGDVLTDELWDNFCQIDSSISQRNEA